MSNHDKFMIKLAYVLAAAGFFLVFFAACLFLGVFHEIGYPFLIVSRNRNTSMKAMMAASASAVSGVAMLLLGFLNFSTRPTKASVYAIEQIDTIGCQMERTRRQSAEHLAGMYSQRYFSRMGYDEFGFHVLLFAVMTVALSVGEGTSLSFLVFVLLVVAISLAAARVRSKLFLEFSGILSDKCQPYAALLAFLTPLRARQRLRIKKSTYGYLSMITLGFYYMGEFERALEHVGLVWEEAPNFVKKTVNQIHFHTIRLYCYQELGLEEAAEQEKAQLEECLKLHPKWERHPYATGYRANENIKSLIETEQYQEARALLAERIEAGNPVYMRVAYHYQMWRVAQLTKDENEAQIHAEYITQYGKDMFYYARINSEQQ